MIGVVVGPLGETTPAALETIQECGFLRLLAYLKLRTEDTWPTGKQAAQVPVISLPQLASLQGLDIILCGTPAAQTAVQAVKLPGVKVLGPEGVSEFLFLITRLRQEINDLVQAQLMLEAIINSTQDAISVVDEQGRGILVNPAYTRLTGLLEKDVLGKPATVDIAEGESIHLQVLATRQAVKGARLKVGPQRKEVLVDVAPIIVQGRLRGSVGVIHDVSEIKRLTEELAQAQQRIRHLEAKYTFEDIIGQSPELRAAIDQARRAADLPATILLRGESGTGKELFAHAIHNASRWRRGQFIRVNCTAIAESLLESELFGYEEGAFTGARRHGKKGYFEEAEGGTVFLDEVGEMSPALQAKLLRVLQEKELIRVGGSTPIPVTARVIAATNINLEQAVQEGRFREDLYYRLNVVPIFIPPLRYRKDDIPLLVNHLLRKFNQQFGRAVERVSPQTLSILVAYDWPGNVRELENALGRAIINMKFNETVI
ncbi:MAG TPA: sigma 54-interacting transcriptional regulator, partial [Firmicutes bacterium]|nr:sigma 54-interacting transcriptional regulator [Bacillota bacterium]